MKIAVVMPVYNRKELLARALTSIRDQTFFAKNENTYRVYLVNNCSTENLREVTRHFNFIKNLYCPYKGNIPAATNLALIEIFKDDDVDYIAHLDSDDTWTKDKMEKQIAYMLKHPEVDICGSGVKYINSKTSRWCKMNYSEFHEDIKKIIEKGLVHMCHGSCVFKPEVYLEVGFYNTFNCRAHDKEFWPRALKYCNLANVPENLYNYYNSEKTFWDWCEVSCCK